MPSNTQDGYNGVSRRHFLGGLALTAVANLPMNDDNAVSVSAPTVEEQIEHPLPETKVRYERETQRGAVVRVTTESDHGWRYLQIWEQNATVVDTGGVGYTDIDLSESHSTTLSTNMDDSELPEPVPWGSTFAVAAFYDGANAVYYGLLIVRRNRPFVISADDIEGYCWWEQAGMCMQQQAVPARLETPDGVIFRD